MGFRMPPISFATVVLPKVLSLSGGPPMPIDDYSLGFSQVWIAERVAPFIEGSVCLTQGWVERRFMSL